MDNDSVWKNLLGFEKMITPTIIKILYFLMLLGVLVSFVTLLFSGEILMSFGILIFGTLGVRLWCELLILMFRIYDQITAAAQYLKEIKESRTANF